ncbi:MAG: hypothetical protein AAB375_01295 [Patescibacteria group bacterium]
MKNLRKFVHDVCRQTGANCFIDITYFAGPRPEVSGPNDIFVARMRMQILLNGAFPNISLCYKDERLTREFGSVYGRGRTADKAFAALLRSIAGKTLTVTIGDTTHTIDVPRNITKGKLVTKPDPLYYSRGR